MYLHRRKDADDKIGSSQTPLSLKETWLTPKISESVKVYLSRKTGNTCNEPEEGMQYFERDCYVEIIAYDAKTSTELPRLYLR